jgi:Protein of unknown function (DUF3575)
MKKLVFALILTTSITFSYAQETVVFSTKSREASASKKKGSSMQNIVKIAPLSFISGFVPVFYERSINDFFSVQAGIGLTTKNYILDAIGEAGGSNSGSTNGINEDYKSETWSDGSSSGYYTDQNSTYGGDERKTTIGYLISVEPRLYFNSEGLDGSFIGLNLSTRRNNYSSSAVTNGATSLTYSGAKVKEFDNLSTMMVNFGYQTLNDNISIEYSGGIGLRKVKGEHYIYATNSTGKYVSGTGFVDKTKVAFDLSFKIGYHF